MELELTKVELAKLLCQSIESKSYADCEDLLELRGADPNYVIDGDYGSAPIHYAVGVETEEIALKFVRLCLKYQGDPNLRNWEGTTPLMVAAIWERPQILKLLLDSGGDLDLRDNEGYSTTDYAEECSDPSVHEAIVHHRDVFVTKRNKSSPTSGSSFISALNENINCSMLDFSDIDSVSSYVQVFIPNNSPPQISENCGKLGSLPSDMSIEDCGKSSGKLSVKRQISDVSMEDPDESGGKLSLESSLSSCPTEKLREELKRSGIFTGPVLKSTKKLYMNRLKNLKPGFLRVDVDEKIGHSDFLSSCFDRQFLSTNLERWKVIELELVQALRIASKSKHLGEKVYFTYLLLDPRKTQEISQNEENLEEDQLMKLFIKAIFYVGKGKNARPIDHLREAVKTKNLFQSSKLKRINEIWNEHLGIVCIYAFHNLTCTDAHIREAAMLDALDGLNLTNQQKGNYFPPASSWPSKKKMQLGALLLYRAMKIYLSEGESQIMRSDL